MKKSTLRYIAHIVSLIFAPIIFGSFVIVIINPLYTEMNSYALFIGISIFAYMTTFFSTRSTLKRLVYSALITTAISLTVLVKFYSNEHFTWFMQILPCIFGTIAIIWLTDMFFEDMSSPHNS